jgi:hypothetical protein
LNADGSVAVLTDSRGIVWDSVEQSVTNTKRTVDGSALLARIDLGYQDGDTWMGQLKINYLMNDSGWFNNLAQSPSFFARRIANIEKDANTAKYGTRSALYTTFDALYHFSPKFSPTATTLANDAASLTNGQTESYNIAPFAKNSWTGAVLTRNEIAIVNELSDPSLQLALPNGLATANRTGLHSLVTAGLGKDNLAEVQGLFTSLSETQAVGGAGKAEFREFGGGGKANVLGYLGFELPLELSASFKQASRKQDAAELTTKFINAGFYWQFVKRFGFTAGFQKIDMEYNTPLAAASDVPTTTILPVLSGTQQQWMVGLDYTLAKHAWLTLNYGVADVENTYYSAEGFSTGEDGLLDDAFILGMPAYLRAAKVSGSNQLIHEFTLKTIDASINVEF